MKEQTVANADYITIKYDVINDLIYADWSGPQTQATVMDGCERILNCLRLYHCKNILNDNTRVTGMWSDAAEWIAQDWIPRMAKSGCKFLAHVYSQDTYAKLSADKVISMGIKDVMVTTFNSKDAAISWLKAV